MGLENKANRSKRSVLSALRMPALGWCQQKPFISLTVRLLGSSAVRHGLEAFMLEVS